MGNFGTPYIAKQIVPFRAFYYIDDGRPSQTDIYEKSDYKFGRSCSRNIETLYIVGEAAHPLILGKNYTVYLQKGKKKFDVNSIFGENCMRHRSEILTKHENISESCYILKS
jgi:hypothetical protein